MGTGDRLTLVQHDFKVLCGLSRIVCAIDTRIIFFKPRVDPDDYLYLKNHRYTLNCQAIIDGRKII